LARDLKIQIEAQVLEDEPHLIMDTEKIERVLLNLVDNALKFSPRESFINVHVYRYVPVITPLLRIDVVDNGPGVPLTERESIFDRFVQIQQHQTRLRRGSGLGLNFCKTAVEAHGGRIWIEDNPSGGSIFSFTLPLSTDDGLRLT
jgi:signal transduction histidine kinase